MTLVQHAGDETIGLEEFVRFAQRRPVELLARLEMSFDVIFTQDRDGITRPGARNPLGRIEIGPRVSEEDLRSYLP